jgi:rubrerythrin
MGKNNEMKIAELTPAIRKQVIQAQKNEVTEYHIYKRLARNAKTKKQKNILNSIAEDELRHYKIWMKYSGTEVDPSRWDLIKFYWLTKLFGIEYGLKRMEKGERRAKINYLEIGKFIPEALKISREETLHEEELYKILEGNRLK